MVRNSEERVIYGSPMRTGLMWETSEDDRVKCGRPGEPVKTGLMWETSEDRVNVRLPVRTGSLGEPVKTGLNMSQ